jgi:hypothetical protein
VVLAAAVSKAKTGKPALHFTTFNPTAVLLLVPLVLSVATAVSVLSLHVSYSYHACG